VKAVDVAERAALGALLLDPAAVDAIGRWLRVTDFADPWNRAAFRTLRELHAAGTDAGPTEVGQHLLVRLGPARADLARIADLIRATPARPDPRAYAVMVLEASLRREIDGHGVLLLAGARAAAAESSARPMLVVTATVDSLLAAEARRWNVATGQVEPRELSGCLAATRPTAVSALAADRYLRSHPPVAPDAAAEHEADLIACLINKPDHLGAVVSWLRPAAIGAPTWRPVYEALLSLRQNHTRIDPVTVLWETQRTAASRGAGPDAALLLARTEATAAASPAYLARLVAADHLRVAADHAAEGLRSAAANPSVQVDDLFTTGHTFTAALRVGAAPLNPDRSETQAVASVHPFPPPHARRTGPVAG
jgi:replicative DNA helicase